MPKNQSSQNSISDDDWLFYEICPKEEIRHCLIYEMARLTPHICEWITKLRQKPSWEDWKEGLEDQKVYQYPTFFFYETKGKFLKACLDFFPEKSWISIPIGEKKKLCSEFFTDIDPVTGEEIHPIPLDVINAYYGPPSKNQNPIWEKAQPGYAHAMHINWDETDNELTARFKAWLKQARPTGTGLKDTSREHLRKDLKALSAWRLCELCGTKAEAFRMVSSKLYEDPATLSRSVTRIQHKAKLMFK